MSYKSPIEIIYGDIQTQIENDIYNVVQSYGINVSKEELIRALKYDRDQYEKGYADAKAEERTAKVSEAERYSYKFAGRCECGELVYRGFPYCRLCGSRLVWEDDNE